VTPIVLTESTGDRLDSHREFGGLLPFVLERHSSGLALGMRFQRAGILAPLCATHMSLELNGSVGHQAQDDRHPQSTMTCNLRTVAVFPAGAEVRASFRSSLVEFAVFLPTEELIASCARDHGLEAERLHSTLASSRVLLRTNWLNEVIHRYLFERVRLNRTDTDGSRFLERELLKEIFYQAESPKSPDAVRVDLDDKGFQPRATELHKAIAFIEAHLFEEVLMTQIAKASGASESTLLRLFRREFGYAPSRYIQNRRLDEARRLLENGRYSVGQVGFMIGYSSSGAFAKAFRERFGHLPSDAR
jgi:AraC-like DNA-binding protein